MTTPTLDRTPVVTWLYVPGDRPDRFEKALGSGADEVIVDLEDAVAPAHKSMARDAVVAWLRRPIGPTEPAVEVRVNDHRTRWGDDDLAAIIGLPGLGGIRLPKAESAADVARIGDALPAHGSVGLHLLVESARGLEAAAELAGAHRFVASIGLGEADLRSELGITDDRGLLWARGRMVVAAAAAGLPPPAMSVWPHLDDASGLAASCLEGRRLGFLGRAAIHPRQLPVIEAAFRPDEAEIADARETMAALAAAELAGQGTAVLPGGRFVDRAMAARAALTMALANRSQRAPRVDRLPASRRSPTG